MKTIYLPITSNKLEYLAKAGIPHTAYFTNQSTHIKLINEPIAYFLAPSFLKKSDLGFIKKVKDFAKKTDLPQTGVNSSDISYYRFNSIPEETGEVMEIDVNKAYWELAHRYGYISSEIYQAGLDTEKIGKLTRLVALGSLASKKKVFQFDGQNYHPIGYQFDPVLRSYFFHVSLELDLIMNRIFTDIGESALFYWFDAFFVSPEVAGYIENELNREGLGIKKQPIREVKKIKSNSFEYLKISDLDKGKPRVRTFTIPNQTLNLNLLSQYTV